MKITKIEIEQFGGLKNYTLELSDGPLYLFGHNEAGKSTLCAFISAMFYGLPGKVRGGGLRGDSRSLYMPWGETYMAGTLSFTSGGKQYVLKRRFGQTAKSDRMSLLSAEDWQEIAIDKSELGQTFLGVGEDAFRKTLFISQLGAVFEKGKEDELVSRLSNLEQSGDEDTSAQKALEELEKVQHGILSKTGRGGTLVQLDAEIDVLKTELLEAKENNKNFQSVLEEIRHLQADLQAGMQTENKLSEMRKAASDFESFLERKKEWERREQQKQELLQAQTDLKEVSKKRLLKEQDKAELAAVSTFSQDVVLDLFEKEATCGVLEKQVERQYELAADVLELEQKMAADSGREKKYLPVFFAVGALLVLFVALGIMVKPIFFGVAPLSLLLLFFLKEGKKVKEEKLTLSARLQEKQQALEKIREEAPEEKLRALSNEINSVLNIAGTESVSVLSKKIEQAKDLSRELEQLMAEESRLEKSVSRLESLLQENIQAEPGDVFSYDGPSTVEVDEQREALRLVQLERERRLAQLNAKVENGFSGKRSVSMVETALEDARRKRKELAEYYETVLLAKTMLEACSEELKNTFAPVINETSGGLIDTLTHGRYQEVRVTDEYKIMLKTPEGNEIVPSEYVSAGTYDLLYFALRLAVLHTLYDQIPLLILDDTFVQLDEERRVSAFSLLQEEPADQILYFSCHKPPEEWSKNQIIML